MYIQYILVFLVDYSRLEEWMGICNLLCMLYDENFSFLISLKLQSNLIPGLNLNALGLFPSGTPGMGPSMSSVPPPGAHAGCSSFGVSDSPLITYCTVACPFTAKNWLCLILKLLQLLGQASENYNLLKENQIFSL